MAQTVSVRIDSSELSEIDKLSRIERKSKSSVLREVLNKGINEKKLEIAIEKFRRNEATAWKASRLAGIPLSKFMDILASNKIDFHYGLNELNEDFEAVRKRDFGLKKEAS